MIEFLMDFASKMDSKIEPEIDKIRALARLGAQMSSKRAALPHFHQVLSEMAWFWDSFWTILNDLSTIFARIQQQDPAFNYQVASVVGDRRQGRLRH